MSGIGPKLHKQRKWMAGTSYVTVPINQDRDEYIQNCFITGTVSITSEAGGITNNVAIGKGELQHIEFPNLSGEFGTEVFYVTDPVHNKCVIVAVLQNENENQDNEENEYVIRRVDEENYCEFRINPKHQIINMTVYGDNADIQFNSIKGNYTVLAKQTIIKSDISTEQIVSVKQVVVGDSKKYSRIIQNKDGVLFEVDKFIIGSEDEAFMLGNTFKKIFDQFIQTVSQATVATPQGTFPLVNAEQIAEFQQQTEQFLSNNFKMKKNV